MEGKQVCQNYLIEKCMGSGQFSRVYRGINIITKEFVALKIIDKAIVEQIPVMMELVPREIHCLQSLNCSNIQKYFAHQETDTQFIIVTEWCNDGDLGQKLKKSGGRFNEQQAIEYFCQILNAFQEMHSKGIVHRDIKLENIMFKNGVIKLIDFGFSKHIDPDQLENKLHFTVLGTPIYMAPELLLEQPYRGLKAEIYSLGVLLYYMVFGRPPFMYPNQSFNDDEALAQVIKQGNIQFEFQCILNIFQQKILKETKASPELRIILTQMLQFDPDKRISFEQLYSSNIIANVLKLNRIRSEGSLGLDQFDVESSRKFYENLEPNFQQKLIFDIEPSQQIQQQQGPIIQIENNQISQIKLDSENLQKQQQQAQKIIKQTYDHQLQLIIRNAINLDYLQTNFKCLTQQQIQKYIHKLIILYMFQNKISVRDQSLALILFKMCSMANDLQQAFQNDTNLFQLENFQFIIQNDFYKSLKSQFKNNYFASIQNYNQLQIPEYIFGLEEDIKSMNEREKEYMQDHQMQEEIIKKELWEELIQNRKLMMDIIEVLQKKMTNQQKINQLHQESLIKYCDKIQENIDNIKNQSIQLKDQEYKIYYRMHLYLKQLINVDKTFKKQNDGTFDFFQYEQEVQQEFNSNQWQGLIEQRIKRM